RLALRVGAARERLDPTLAAEHVMDDVLVELVVGQYVLALLELELLDRGEGEQRASAAAHRTVARNDRLREVELDGVADRAAVTASRVRGGGHGDHSTRPRPLALASSSAAGALPSGVK